MSASDKCPKKTRFAEDLAMIYAKSQEQSEQIYEFFHALQSHSQAVVSPPQSDLALDSESAFVSESVLALDTSLAEKYALLYALARQCGLGAKREREISESNADTPSTAQLLAIAERIVNLREDRLIQQLHLMLDSETANAAAKNSESAAAKKQRINKARAFMLEFVSRFYQRRQEELLGFIKERGLLSEFYCEVLEITHSVGLAMNAFFKAWQEQLIDGINEELGAQYNLGEALELLKESLERDEEGQIAGRCYSIPLWQGGLQSKAQGEFLGKGEDLAQIQNLGESQSHTSPNHAKGAGRYISLPYASAFPREVETIRSALEEGITRLSKLEDKIFSRKSAYIAYFEALSLAWGERDSTQLITRWREVDRAWLGIDTPLQVAHPFEYYEDIYRHSVAPEWDLRLSNPNALPSYAKANVSAMFEAFASRLSASEALRECVRASMGQSSLYNSLPLLFYGAEHNGLFSAQVVPNDESVSNLLGKKIFAFPDRIIAQARAKPRLRINAEFFEEAFLARAREVLFKHEGLWQYVYDVSTNGHEFGHILWVDTQSEGVMNDGEFKNIEEFKATCGGLVAWIAHYEGDLVSKMSESRALYDEMRHYEESLGGKEAILEILMSDTIRRAVGLVAWRESVEVRPYYCEGLLHLCGMFESGVLSFDKASMPKLRVRAECFGALCEWYKHTYASLAQHYMAKAKAGAWLKKFINTQTYLPHNEVVREFVEHYWERYLSIGGEILED